MIADPMANLTGAPAPGQHAASAGAGNRKEVFDPVVMQVNLQRIDRIHAVMGIASGVVAGILGLTGLEGLGTFLSSDTRGCYHCLLCLFVSIARRPHPNSLSPFLHNVIVSTRSVFRRTARVRIVIDLGNENEIPVVFLRKEIVVRVPDDVDPAHGPFFHAVLDALLRTRVPLLERSYRNMCGATISI